MTVLFVLVTILYLLLTNPINIVNPLLFALVMVSYIFPYLKYTISGFSFKSSGRNFFAFINIIFIFLINVSSLHYLSNNDLIKIDIFQGAIISLFIVSYILLQRGFTINYPACNITFYVCFLLGLLLVFSIATSIKFFEASVNHEIIRGIKRDQLNLASQRESRNLQLRNYYCLMEQNHQLNLSVKNVYEQRLERGIYSKFDSSTFYVKGKTFWKDIDKDSQNFIRAHKVRDYQGIESIINFFRPVYDRTSVETKYLESDSLLRGNQIWTICEKALVFDYLSDSEKYKSTKPDSCRIYTNLQRPDIFNPLSPVRSDIGWPLFNKYGIIFSLFLLVVLYGIFILIQFATRRMLGISILEMHSEYNFGNFIRERIASGHSVMVISSSFINVSDYVKENLKDSFDLTAIDFAKRDDIIANEKLTSEKDVLIIENFAFDYYSQSSLVMQMDMISEMIRQKKKMVITCINAPYFIEDYLYRKVKSIGDLKEKDKSDTVTVNWEQLQLSFNNILSNVNVLYTPEKYDQNTSHTDCYSKLKCDNKEINYAGDCGENLRCLICSELEVSTYLHRYSHEMMNFYDRLMELQIPRQIIKDRIIQRIMDLSRLYYDNILVTCTPMERFVLSDMAQDMIVNSKNQKVVNTLIHRGLFIINDCSIRFMNESFRKHVLLRFTSGEKARIKEELGDTGTSWQGYKIFLILIMIGLISFLFIANRAILDNLNKLFLVIGGGTVLISNLTGILTRKETDDTK